MPVEIVTLPLGLVQTNCYILGDPATGEAVVIDPADSAAVILSAAGKRGWTIRLMLATHAHFDHVLAVESLREATGAPFRLHEADWPLLQAMQLTGQWFGLELAPPPRVDGTVTAGEVITVGGIALAVCATPGHSAGHVCYVLESERTVFSGDCLFAGSVGRTDLPGGDHAVLMRSIADQLLPLGDDYQVLPGHGESTTIGWERRANPFLVEWSRQGDERG